jgi:hypothetical protein
MNLIVKQIDLIQFENELNLNTKIIKFYYTIRFTLCKLSKGIKFVIFGRMVGKL